MRIIKMGKLHERETITDCDKCGTKFAFKKSDAKFVADQRDGDYYMVDCPACTKRGITIAADLIGTDTTK